MRRAVVMSALGLGMLSACSGPVGPRAPLPSSAPLSPALGVQDAAARGAAIRFLQAYASASQDGGDALIGIVAGPLGERWAHSVTLQNVLEPGYTGTADITSVGAPQLQPPGQGSRAVEVVVEVRATVTLRPPAGSGGSAAPVVRSFDGPMTLAQTGPAEWRVVSFNRDGAKLEDFFKVYSGEITRNAVTVHVDSLIMTDTTWRFDVQVSNDGDRGISIDERNTILLVDRTALARAVATFPGPIQPGGSQEGFLSFPPQTNPGEYALQIEFTTDTDPIVVGVRIGDPTSSPGARDAPSVPVG